MYAFCNRKKKVLSIKGFLLSNTAEFSIYLLALEGAFQKYVLVKKSQQYIICSFLVWTSWFSFNITHMHAMTLRQTLPRLEDLTQMFAVFKIGGILRDKAAASDSSVLVLPVLGFLLPVRQTDATVLGQNTTAGTTRCRRWETTVTFDFELGRGQNGPNTGNRKWKIGRKSALCRIAEFRVLCWFWKLIWRYPILNRLPLQRHLSTIIKLEVFN